jgi:hypothetical protein
MGGEREHVRDQPTVREHFDGLGMSIYESLVEAGLLDDSMDFV